MQGIHITSLELENVKKVKAVALEPAAAGLTVIGGRNGAGKTSVLDAIAWALGGEKFRPDAAKRSGSVLDPMLRVQLSNGLTVTRKGPKGALTVTDETGRRSGQQLLNSFIEVLALDLPRFLGASDKERAAILLNLLGLQDQLDALEREERAKYDTRLQTGRDRDQARHHADSLDYYPDAGAPVSVTALTEKLKEAQAENARNRAFREKIGQLEVRREEIQERIRELQAELGGVNDGLRIAQEQAESLTDRDEDAILQQIQAADEINAKVRANAARTEADQRASLLADEYDALTGEIEDIRARRAALLEGADMPLEGLSVQEGVLTYQGQPWSCMSSAEQLRAATAIVARLKPECRFVLVDKLEQMDTDTLRQFGAWAAEQGLQVIGTRVSTGGECTVIIEDGEIAEETAAPAPKWKEGTF
jgi:hypothetical protein